MKVSGFCGGAIVVGLFWEYIDIAVEHTAAGRRLLRHRLEEGFVHGAQD